MRIAFFILGKKGYEALNAFIIEFGSDKVAYVTSSRDKGVKNDFYSEINYLCEVNKISFFDKENYSPNVNYDYSFAIGWKWILHETNNLIVFHDSPLPRYRGFAPLVSMLINREPSLTVTALLATNEYDKGPIIKSISTNIEYPIKISQAIDLVVPLYVALVVDITKNLNNGKKLEVLDQHERLATYSLWRDEQDYFINWSLSACHIQTFINAVGYPYKGAASYLNNNLVRIQECILIEDVKIEHRQESIGKVIFMDNGLPVVVCGDGLLKLTSIFLENSISQVSSIPFRSRFSNKIL